MYIAHTIADLRRALKPAQVRAFVPTMGNLHDGHLALMRTARAAADMTVASIFVNRLQFLPHEDFDSYPRTWERDCELLAANGCDVLLPPRSKSSIPNHRATRCTPRRAWPTSSKGRFAPAFLWA